MRRSDLLLFLAVGVAADWPPAPRSGGAPCSVNAECGVPAANCNMLREECVSMTGSCQDGRCICKANDFGCPNCHAKAILDRSPEDPTTFQYRTEHPMLDGTRGRLLDECAAPSGGKSCSTDLECGGQGGLCIASKCVCPDAWQCEDCSLTLTDRLYGLECGVAANGGGECRSSADCYHGSCEPSGNGRSFCACQALHACPHCEHPVADLVSGAAMCPESAAEI
mmetsp:Transcript_14897/g.38167  ORF Transcript_14897/g.38167 Transcript_14897/m.38167 type:complete len:224 (+) Transcript_14897:240-911(+)|eukprot:CAMPEP_0182927820 /NCGR_PEP_ID=MMETSP0105_2-20130417/14312_1 /TAXON_ID=81532 ORGANISM="Acanthoeca-like sp., Strain 10tr" /NCGR_SAMPLE_ID=MMETSP0105_2 /ASSEMBLY_ACC=CAM_ASM_000205 /LENGTH=223 /DNA_ID=CAMNT_0025065789 /DNA_START=213 /DNA_END=884 /DNA_ORIENTATION=-